MSDDEQKVPTVEIVGQRVLDPVFGEDLEPLVYKLHAVEVHQYIPIEGVPTPEFVHDCSNYTAMRNVLPDQWVSEAEVGKVAPTLTDVRSMLVDQLNDTQKPT